MGGLYSLKTSEKVKLDGSVEDSFGLKYNTGYTLCISLKIQQFIFDRWACAIPDPDNEEVIITGGLDTLTTVSVYNETGWQRDLAPLNQGRNRHACGSYVNGGTKVNNIMYV